MEHVALLLGSYGQTAIFVVHVPVKDLLTDFASQTPKEK